MNSKLGIFKAKFYKREGVLINLSIKLKIKVSKILHFYDRAKKRHYLRYENMHENHSKDLRSLFGCSLKTDN